MIRALANHTMMLCGVDNLARRRIEQHAYIPYTHGCRRICDRLLRSQDLLMKPRRNGKDLQEDLLQEDLLQEDLLQEDLLRDDLLR